MKGWALWPLMAVLLSGCASGIDTPPHIRGYLFSDIRVPYTPDLHNTPVSDIGGNGLGIRVEEPFTGRGISAEVDSNAIGDIARKNGMKEVYFADREEMNILRILGLFRRRRLYIYGK